jgi:hypothetical protein
MKRFSKADASSVFVAIDIAKARHQIASQPVVYERVALVA